MKRMHEELYRVNIILTVDIDEQSYDTVHISNIISKGNLDRLVYSYQNIGGPDFGEKLFETFGPLTINCSTDGESQNGHAWTCYMNTDEIIINYFDSDYNPHTVTVGWENVYCEGITAMSIYSSNPDEILSI